MVECECGAPKSDGDPLCGWCQEEEASLHGWAKRELARLRARVAELEGRLSAEPKPLRKRLHDARLLLWTKGLLTPTQNNAVSGKIEKGGGDEQA